MDRPSEIYRLKERLLRLGYQEGENRLEHPSPYSNSTLSMRHPELLELIEKFAIQYHSPAGMYAIANYLLQTQRNQVHDDLRLLASRLIENSKPLEEVETPHLRATYCYRGIPDVLLNRIVERTQDFLTWLESLDWYHARRDDYRQMIVICFDEEIQVPGRFSELLGTSGMFNVYQLPFHDEEL